MGWIAAALFGEMKLIIVWFSLAIQCSGACPAGGNCFLGSKSSRWFDGVSSWSKAAFPVFPDSVVVGNNDGPTSVELTQPARGSGREVVVEFSSVLHIVVNFVVVALQGSKRGGK